jgi:hypothetical protein
MNSFFTFVYDINPNKNVHSKYAAYTAPALPGYSVYNTFLHRTYQNE